MPTITVAPASIVPGTNLTVLGQGFLPWAKLTLRVDGGKTDFVFRPAGRGAFEVGVWVGIEASPGAHRLDVFDWHSGAHLTTLPFTVAAPVARRGVDGATGAEPSIRTGSVGPDEVGFATERAAVQRAA